MPDIDLFIFGDNSDARELVQFLMGKLPSNVSEYINRTCLIVTINNSLNGFCIPSHLVKDRNIIVLNYRIYEKDRQKFIKTLYHEIAHVYLEHKVLFGKNSGLEEAQEREADKLVTAWLNS